MIPCDLPVEDLVAYADGELHRARREIVEAHCEACPTCRRRLAIFHEVDALLQTADQPLDTSDQRLAITARLTRADIRPPTRLLHRAGLAVVSVAVAVVVAVVGAAWWLEPPNRQATAWEAVAPSDLPSGLVLVRRSSPNAGRLELLYANRAGLTLLLVEEPARAGSRAPAPPDVRILTVANTPVHWRPGEAPEEVSEMSWEDDGVAFILVVLDPAAEHLDLQEARQIVETLMGSH